MSDEEEVLSDEPAPSVSDRSPERISRKQAERITARTTDGEAPPAPIRPLPPEESAARKGRVTRRTLDILLPHRSKADLDAFWQEILSYGSKL